MRKLLSPFARSINEIQYCVPLLKSYAGGSTTGAKFKHTFEEVPR